jgi:hypothetical protein
MARRPDEAVNDPGVALAQSLARRFEATAGYKNVLDERGNALMAVNERSGPRSKAYTAIEEHLKKADQQLERIRTVVRRPISRLAVRSWLVGLIGFGLAVFEAPANKFLFDNALQSNGFASFAASFAVTGLLLVLAHFAGRSIRQVWSDFRKTIIWSNPLIFLLCIGGACTIIAILTIARAAFAVQGGTIGELLTGVQSSVTSMGALGALAAALADTSAVVLASINLGGFLAAFLLAFFSHDSDRDYDLSQNSVDRDEKSLNKTHTAYLKERSKVVARFAPDLLGLAANYNSANSRVIELKTRLQQPLDDDDRFVLTDLDQMSEDAEKQDREEGHVPEPRRSSSDRVEPSVTSMSDYRRPTGTDPA